MNDKLKNKSQKAKVKGRLGFKLNHPLAFAFCLLTFAMLLDGCKSPFDRTQDKSGGGPTGQFGQAPAFVIFSSELVSGGGAFLYPGGEGQTLSFNDRSNPISQRSIRYSWTGESVSNPGCSPDPTHNFAGVDLMHTPTLATYDATPGRDLHLAGYTKVTFFARGSLSSLTLIKIEVASGQNPAVCTAAPSPCVSLSMNGTDDDSINPCGTTAKLSGSWQAYTIPITGPTANMTSIKNYFKATYVFNDPFPGNPAPGQGGTVYFDQIQYQP